ncbi:sporulation protein [Cytobacillus gottheilii]|uniref:Sporulation protein n=2 Tax=Cytobacillus gottheilii TaxID=859144 RepID=A0ABX8FFU9_9BACI|nr:sporulation protein [Cytobacillus gottheilii]QVY62910.1 sporulation protein [Cytobacillus gottheilii]
MKKIIFFCFFIVIMSGCSHHDSKNSPMSLIREIHPTPAIIGSKESDDIDMLNKVKKDVEDMEELFDVAVIKGEKEILVAYKVKHLQRFHMVKIEEKLNKMLEEDYPDEDFIVSSDFKIFLEAVELHDKMEEDKDYSEEKAQKKFDKIIKLKKEMT